MKWAVSTISFSAFFLLVHGKTTVYKIIFVSCHFVKLLIIDPALAQEMNDLYNENFNSLKKGIRKDIRKRGGGGCPPSWISIINSVKMIILPKVIPL